MACFPDGSSTSPCSSACSRTPACSGEEAFFKVFVQILLLSSDKSEVLMTYENDEWRLPYFYYENPNSLDSGRRISRFCNDMRHFFGVPSDRVQFTATVELIGQRFYAGERCDINATGWQWVLVTECQPDGCPEKLPLPNKRRSAWKDLTFFSAYVERLENQVDIDVMRKALQYMQPDSALHVSLSDPRLEMGWFKKAAGLLVEVALQDGAEELGQVIQQQMMPENTILKVNSSLGWYFAKSPALGCNEGPITAEIARLFPESSPKVLATNAELNCFVTKGFNHKPPGSGDLRKFVRKLGEMQLKSISHVNELAKAGCPIRDPVKLMEKLKLWETKPPFAEHIRRPKKRLLELVPIALDACRKLEGYNIPNTLVHGDLAQSNATYSGEECESLWLFDWQFACISHPFSDFYRLTVRENIPEELLNDMVDEYLRMWEPFETLERAREAYEIACMLGFFLKLWAIEVCKSSCDYQDRSNWESMTNYVVNEAYETILERERSD